jgi:hypothetical protein
MNNCVKIIDIAKPDNPVRSFGTYFKGMSQQLVVSVRGQSYLYRM